MENHLGAELLTKLERTASKLVARAWTDLAFRERFVKNPKAVLQEAGVLLGSLIVVVVITGQDAHAAQLARKIPENHTIYEVVLPPPPGDLQEEPFDAEVNNWEVAWFCFTRGCMC